MVLYRKYRPQKFAEIVGQKAIVSTLSSQLKSGKISHGYLFCGSRGTGKTSTARIIAKSVNCQAFGRKIKKGQPLKFGEPCNRCLSCLAIADGSHLDLVEIDAASNRNIDDVRDLREKIKLVPVSGRFKVYIIDEVHMLTREAFNALLKTLEEPPSHAIFILCTTEVNKVPATILSRVQRFNFKRATGKELIEAVSKIAKHEGIRIDKEAIEYLVQASDGSFRDAISILDQLSGEGKEIKAEAVEKIAVFSGWSRLSEFVNMLSARDTVNCVLRVEEISQQGADLSSFAKELVLFLEKLLFIKIGASVTTLDLSNDQIRELTRQAGDFTFDDLQNLMKLLLIAEGEMRHYPLPQIPLVLAVCKYCLSTFGQLNTVGTSRNLKNEGKTNQNASTNSLIKTSSRSAKGMKVSKDTAKTFVKIQDKWGEFLNKVKPINAHVVALLRSSRPTDFDGQNLTIEVFFRFHKEKLEEPKIMSLVCDMLAKTMGFSISPKFVLAQRATKPTRTVVASDVSEINEDELVKITQEIFSE